MPSEKLKGWSYISEMVKNAFRTIENWIICSTNKAAVVMRMVVITIFLSGLFGCVPAIPAETPIQAGATAVSSRDEFVWEMSEGYPTFNPQEIIGIRTSGTKGGENYYFQEIASDGSTIYVRDRWESGTTLNHDWEFELRIEGTPPGSFDELESSFGITLSGRVTDNSAQLTNFVGVTLGIGTSGFIIETDPVTDPPNPQIFIGNGQNGFVDSNKIDVKLILPDASERFHKLTMNIYIGGKGNIYIYEWERKSVDK